MLKQGLRGLPETKQAPQLSKRETSSPRGRGEKQTGGWTEWRAGGLKNQAEPKAGAGGCSDGLRQADANLTGVKSQGPLSMGHPSPVD